MQIETLFSTRMSTHLLAILSSIACLLIPAPRTSPYTEQMGTDYFRFPRSKKSSLSPFLPLKAKRFGPQVRDWMKSMLSKAVDTSWQIEIGITSNLLTEALKAYYGW
jgi:hypothetical protein